jgi:hypothetical protein
VSERKHLLAVALVVLVLVVAAVVTDVGGEAPTATAIGPRLDAVGATTTWYCAEGTANPGGRANEQVLVGNVDRAPTHVTITVDSGSDVPPVSRALTVDPGAVVRVPVSSIAPVAAPGVVVETDGGRAVVEHRLDRAGDSALGPCAREPAATARFAAGTTSKGAELWLALFNPFPDDAIVDVAAITDGGPRAPGRLQGIVVPHLSRVSVPIHDAIQRVDTVSTQVTTRRGRVVVEQSEYLDGSDGRRGLALSLGRDAARVWQFPINLMGSGRQERLVLANPSGRDATVTLSVALEAAAAVEPQQLVLPAASVLDADLGRVPPEVPFSMAVRSNVPIVAATIAAYTSPQPASVRGIASDLGLTAGATTWAIVPTRLDAGSSDVVAVVSADGRRHDLDVFGVDASGRRSLATTQAPGTGRAVVDLARLGVPADRALLLVADGPVMVERESTAPGVTRSHAVPG